MTFPCMPCRARLGRGRRVIAAGTDVALHCNGQMAEMSDVAANVPALEGLAALRFEAGVGCDAA